jgi:hypothetical protein
MKNLAGAIVVTSLVAAGLIAISVFQSDYWLLLALLGVGAAYLYHSPNPNLIDCGVVLLVGGSLAIAGLLVSPILLVAGVLCPLLWVLNSVLTGISLMSSREPDRK